MHVLRISLGARVWSGIEFAGQNERGSNGRNGFAGVHASSAFFPSAAPGDVLLESSLASLGGDRNRPVQHSGDGHA